MNQQQKQTIKNFKQVWVKYLDSDDATDHFWRKEVEKAEMHLEKTGVRFSPGKGFTIKRR